VKVRKVSGHAGDPCPVCETPIATVANVDGTTIHYCPGCQTDGIVLPDGRRSLFCR
jgi:formamidopyrimidine-DNA glycosylase